MSLLNKFKTQAQSIGSSIGESTSKLSGDIVSSTKDNAKLAGLKSDIASIDGQLNIAYQDIGRKYIENLIKNDGANLEAVLQDTIERIDPLIKRKDDLEAEVIAIEKQLKDQIVIQEKAVFQKEFDGEKEKLEKALKLDIISQDEFDAKLAKARVKLDNFDEIRKTKKQHEMGLIDREELKEKLTALGA